MKTAYASVAPLRAKAWVGIAIGVVPGCIALARLAFRASPRGCELGNGQACAVVALADGARRQSASERGCNLE